MFRKMRRFTWLWPYGLGLGLIVVMGGLFFGHLAWRDRWTEVEHEDAASLSSLIELGMPRSIALSRCEKFCSEHEDWGCYSDQLLCICQGANRYAMFTDTWVVRLFFDHDTVAAILIRSSHSAAYRPKEAPQDRIDPALKARSRFPYLFPRGGKRRHRQSAGNRVRKIDAEFRVSVCPGIEETTSLYTRVWTCEDFRAPPSLPGAAAVVWDFSSKRVSRVRWGDAFTSGRSANGSETSSRAERGVRSRLPTSDWVRGRMQSSCSPWPFLWTMCTCRACSFGDVFSLRKPGFVHIVVSDMWCEPRSAHALRHAAVARGVS